MATTNVNNILDALMEENVGANDTISFRVKKSIPTADQIQGKFVSVGHSPKGGDFIIVHVVCKIPAADICLETLKKIER